MKTKLIVLISIFLTILSCSKEDTSEVYQTDGNKISSTISSTSVVRLQSLINKGNLGGRTQFQKQSASKNGKNEGLFLSQYPLIEHRYKMNIQYDSFTEHIIDTITQDTLYTYTRLEEVSRDTFGFKTGKLWVGYEQLYKVDLYIGNITTDSVRIRWEETDGLVGAVVGNLYKYAVGNTVDVVGAYGTIDDFKYLRDLEHEETNIPIFNENGRVTDSVSGVKVPIYMKHMLIYDNKEVTRKFRLTIYDGENVVFNDYEVYFIPYETYLKRMCWLEGKPMCADMFDE